MIRKNSHHIMKSKVSLIVQNLKSDRYLAVMAYILAFSFALWPFVVSLSFILFGFLAIFHLRKPNHQVVKPVHVMLFGALFLLYVVALPLTPTIDRALVLVHRISPIFLVPLLIYLTRLHKILNFKTLKFFFVVGLLVSCTLSLIVAVIKVISLGDLSSLFYYKLAAFWHLHPTYYSLFILTAIHFLMNHQNTYLRRFKTSILLFFGVIIFLLQVKIAVIGLFIYMLVYLAVYRKGSFKKRKLVLPAILLLLLMIIGSQLEVNRFGELFENRSTIEIGNSNEDGVHQRFWLWEQAFLQLREKPLLGFGLGSQNSIFRWKVEKENLLNQDSYNYSIATKEIASKNLHNQYVQTLYELGFVGGVVYLASIVVLLWKGYKNKKSDFLLVFGFFLLFLITENLLERQLGIYFYAFIVTLLFFEKDLAMENSKDI